MGAPPEEATEAEVTPKPTSAKEPKNSSNQDMVKKNVPEENEEDIFDDILDLEEDGPTNEAVEADNATKNRESSKAVDNTNAKSPHDNDEEMDVDDNKVATPEPETEQNQTSNKDDKADSPIPDTSESLNKNSENGKENDIEKVNEEKENIKENER